MLQQNISIKFQDISIFNTNNYKLKSSSQKFTNSMNTATGLLQTQNIKEVSLTHKKNNPISWSLDHVTQESKIENYIPQIPLQKMRELPVDSPAR